jgi:organic radical activating enzyme
MRFSEYVGLHCSFYKAVVLQLGLQCPLRCRHCSVYAGPSRREKMPTELAIRVIRSVAETDEGGVVVITGGEPFAMLDTLTPSLTEICRHTNLSSHVITSAHWAKTIEDAFTTLRSLPEISLMTVSADFYHEEFVPVEYVSNAVRAAHSLGRDVAVSVAVDSSHPNYLDRVQNSIGDDIWKQIDHDVVPVMPTGRAKVNGIGAFENEPTPLPSGACDYLGTPVVLHNGMSVCCCQIDATNDAQRGNTSFYTIGNMSVDSYTTLRDRVDADVVKQALRVWGPKGLVERLHESGFPPELKASYTGICFLCRDLMTKPEVVSRLRRLLSSDKIQNELTIGRMLQYGELRPCPVL